MSVPPLDKYGVALASVGFRRAPVSPIEVVNSQGGVFCERELPDRAKLMVLAKPLNVKTASLNTVVHIHPHHGRARKSSSTERKKISSALPEPPLLSLNTSDKRDDSGSESDSSGGLPEAGSRRPAVSVKDSTGPRVKTFTPESAEKVIENSGAQKKTRHGHRRSLSTSEHLHFAGKPGPPTLSALAFQPKDDSSEDESDAHSSNTNNKHEQTFYTVKDDNDEISSVISNSSRLSVVRTEVSPSHRLPLPPRDHEILGSNNNTNNNLADKKIVITKGPLSRVAATETPHSSSPTNGGLRVGANSPHYRPRRSSAPDLDSIVESGNLINDKKPVEMPESTRSQATRESTPRSQGERSESESIRSNRSGRRHNRQYSAPVVVGGGVDAADDEQNPTGNVELKLPDGLVITRSGISSNSSTPEKTVVPTMASKKSPLGRARMQNYKSDEDVQSSTSSQPSSNPSPRPSPGLFNPDDLITLGLIGKGTAGVVTKALHVSALRVVAVKSVQKFDAQKRETTIAEIRALYRRMIPFSGGRDGQEVSEENGSCILGFYDAYIPEGGAAVNLVLEWMDGGSLQDLVDKKKAEGKALSEDFISLACRRMLKGLCELYDERLLHRDMKPANVLVSRSGAIKLSDFGVSVAFGFGELSNARTFVGSLSYMAPERVQTGPENSGYSYASDLWGVGLIAYVCATGEYPFSKHYDEDGFWGMVQAVMEEVPSLDPTKFSPEFVDFVAQCLRRDPQERPTAQEHLNHPFVCRFMDTPETSKKIIQEVLGQVDQEAAKAELIRLLTMAANYQVANAMKQQHTMPRFSIARVKLLADQLGVEFANEDELHAMVNSINSRMLMPRTTHTIADSAGSTASSKGGDKASPGKQTTSQDSPRVQNAPHMSMWRKNNLTLDLTM